MNALSNMALASNERKERNIIQLRQLFDYGKVYTVASAQKKLGYTRQTILRWCREGNIPLVDTEKDHSGKTTVVPMDATNKPKLLNDRK